jgi:hypothetical protein
MVGPAQHRFLATLTATAIALTARIALAGTPLSDTDPLLVKGVLPSSAAVLAGESAHATAAIGLAGALRRCHDAGVKNAFADKPSGLAECEATATLHYQAAISRIEPPRKTLPACLDVGAEQAFLGRFARSNDAVRYCAGSSPLADLDPLFGAGMVPPDAATLRGERAVAKALDKLLLSLRKCHAAAVRSAFKGGKRYDLASCIGAANDKYSLALFKIVAPKSVIPDCLNTVAEQAYVNSLVQNSDGFWYCD